MKTPNAKVIISTRRKWLRRILITVAVIVLLPIGLFTIGWLNRDTVIDVLQEWYRENHTGTLTIGKVNTNFFSGFPKVGFTLKDIQQTNTDTITDQFSTLQIDEAKLVIGAKNLLSGNIKFEKIVIKNAIISSEVISTKSLAYHEKLRLDNQNLERKGFQLPQWLDEKGASFLLDNVKYINKDTILDKYFNLDIHKIEGFFKGTDLKMAGSASFDITVNNMGFNTRKGSYFNGAHVSGRPKFTINLDNYQIEIVEFPLDIDKQSFTLNANFDLSDSNTFVFQLKNPRTDFNAVKGLLPDSLAVKIKKYDIRKPIRTSLNLSGSFGYGDDPTVDAEFSTEDNVVLITDKFIFKNASFSGNLTNVIYETDSLRKAKKSGKDIKIFFKSINAQLGDIEINVRDSYYQSTPEAWNYVSANINLNGSNEALATLIDMDNFDFKGGTFSLDAIISGDIPSPYQFLNKATGNFNLNNTRVILKRNGLQLPIQSIDLSLKRENSLLRELIINLPNDDNLVLRGELKSISGLLSKEPKIPTTSRIYLDSKNLNINEIISLAKSFVPKSEANVNDRKNLHETLEAVYGQFHPRFEINVEALQYNDVIINDVSSNIELVNPKTILLRNFDFKYLETITNLKGRVIVPEPESKLKDAIYMDAEATSNGSISVFKELFNIQLFRIDSGNYNFYGNVKGNVKEFSELLNNARGDLTLLNTKLHYAPADMNIVIDSLALFVDNSDILLKKFNLEIDEVHTIQLHGNITQFPTFLIDNKQTSGSIFLNITASFIDGDTLLATIKSFKNEEKIKDPKNRRALHTLFKDINKFRPEIELAIDSLKYSDLITENIKALVKFENDSILTLKNLDLQYKSTTANINGSVNAHISQLDSLNDNPFDLDFSVKVKGRSEDLNDYLKTTNFIFKSGDFEFKGNYKAQAEDLNVVNSKTFGDLKIGNTLVDFKAADLQIPVDSLHIEIDDDIATLKTLDIDLPGKSSVEFSGSIDNFSEFINNSEDSNRHSSNFSIYSPYLDSSDIKEFLKTSTTTKQKTEDTDLNLKKFKNAMVKINSSFYPTVGITIDTLRHKAFNLTDFEMDMLFDTQGNFKIEDTQLNFYGGSIAMNLGVGINYENIPVTIDMQATNVDIHELVTRFDYFNDDDLRNAEKIEGNLNYAIIANGTLGIEGKLNMASLNGTLQLNLQDFALYNYQPIMDNSILMKDERFKNLRFQPIVQTFEIKNGEIIIPRTEIQSSAIHVFVEGKLKLNDYIDIWLSLPYKNLKSNDGLTLPEKTSYADAGSKFYVHLVQDKNSEKERNQKIKVKVRLSNRKLRKQK